MRSVTSEQMRELDRRTIEEYGTSGEVLMERAGAGLAESVLEIISASRDQECKVLAFAGHGNNGGDAFVAARILTERGVDSEVVLCCDESKIKGDAKVHLERSREAGVQVVAGSRCQVAGRKKYLILDGILGTGIEGEVRGAAAEAIGLINELGERNVVVAIDIPSGIHGDTGKVLGAAVKADRTVTMGLPKIGLLRQEATDYVGALEVIDIGIPAEYSEGLDSGLEFVDGNEACSFLCRRKASAHKGTFGHVLVIGGAKGFAGAPAMAARAALRSGAGLVSVFTPESAAGIVAGAASELMVHPAAETVDGSMSADALRSWEKELNDFDAVVIGPGMTACEDTGKLLAEVIGSCTVPLVIDADALNMLAADPGMAAGAACEIVLTPHPGEMARLMGCSNAEVQAGRVEKALDLAGQTGAVVVLKGAGTVIARKGMVPRINRTGNPGMGAGGMGDVLSGIIGAFAAGGADLYDAASAGVYIHGRAGDLAAMAGSQVSLTAGDLIDVLSELPAVFRDITGR